MSPTESSDEVYEVESIEQKRIHPDGREEYYIKWKDYGQEDNTWEPSENLDCKDLIEEFEEKGENIIILKDTKKSKKKSTTKEPATPSAKKSTGVRQPAQSTPTISSKTGFDEGLSVERILGATDAAGEIMFLIKWKERNEASLISSSVARAKCPQQVITYLEGKITFVSDERLEEISA